MGGFGFINMMEYVVFFLIFVVVGLVLCMCIKLCGLLCFEDVLYVVVFGVDVIGFVFYLKSLCVVLIV